MVEGEIYAVCPEGSGVFIHGDVWHGGRANHSRSTRRVIHLGFSCPATAPQYEIADRRIDEVAVREKPLKIAAGCHDVGPVVQMCRLLGAAPPIGSRHLATAKCLGEARVVAGRCQR